MKLTSVCASALLLVLAVGCGDDDPKGPTGPFTVSYTGNAPSRGDPPRDEATYKPGETVTVLGAGTLEKDGSFFAGWTTVAGENYQPGNTFVMGEANVLLYANWSAAQTYPVSYNGNGHTSGNPPNDSRGYAEGATVTVLGQGAMTKAGHVFTGWTDGTNDFVTGDTFAMPARAVTPTAKWLATATFGVTYTANGGTGAVPTDSGAYPAGATVTVLGTGSLVRAGVTFTGWRLDTTTLQPGDTFVMPADDVALAAQWTAAATFALNYNGNGNTAGTVPSSVSLEEDQQVAVATGTGLKINTRCFDFWTTAADRTGTKYDPPAQFTMGPSAVTLYAQYNRLPVLTIGGMDAGTTVAVSQSPTDSYALTFQVGDVDAQASTQLRITATLTNTAVPSAVFDTARINTALTGIAGATVTDTSISVLATITQINGFADQIAVVAPAAEGAITVNVVVDDLFPGAGCNAADAVDYQITYAE